MAVLLVFFLAGAIGAFSTAVVFRVVHRHPVGAVHGPVHATARVVQREMAAHRTFRTFVQDRLSPAKVTGLALTVALTLLVVVAVLAFEVRRQAFVAEMDLDIARWAADHASASSSSFLLRFTDLGSTAVVAAITVAVAIVEVLRTRARGVVVFLAVTVLGANLATNLVKAIVGRPRPDVDPLAHFSGFSFPSGHSSAAAACFAACALCLSRRRSLPARLVLTCVAAALAVMVATSRVLLGVHWASDAFAGLCFGAGWFALCAIAFGGRLLRFGAPVEVAARAEPGAVVEVPHGPQREARTDEDADGAEHGADGDVREEVHAEDHP